MKKGFFLQKGAFWRAVRGPPKRQLEDHRASLKMRRECGPWTAPPVVPELPFKLVIFDTFFCFPHFAWNPYFYGFLFKFSFKMFKLEAKIGQKLRPSKTNLNCWRAVLWTPNCPSKIRHECKPKKKKATAKKWQQRETQTLLSAERSVFGEKKEETFDYLLALGLLIFLWPKASKHNSAKNTIKQGVLLCLLLCFLWLLCP